MRDKESYHGQFTYYAET